MKYSEKDMAALISEVEAQFSEHLAKAETDKTDLKKSEAKSEPAVESKIAKSEEPKVESEEAETTQFDYNDEDFAEMDTLYGSMTKAEAEAHYKSVKKAVFGSEPVAVEKTEEPVKIAKSEAKTGEGEELRKSNEGLKAENEKLQKNFQSLVDQLTKFVRKDDAPKQKAITKIEYIAKTEEEEKIDNKEDVSKLSADEISTRLTDKIRSGSLKKSDKENINEYYLDGKKNIETIRHLL